MQEEKQENRDHGRICPSGWKVVNLTLSEMIYSPSFIYKIFGDNLTEGKQYKIYREAVSLHEQIFEIQDDNGNFVWINSVHAIPVPAKLKFEDCENEKCDYDEEPEYIKSFKNVDLREFRWENKYKMDKNNAFDNEIIALSGIYEQVEKQEEKIQELSEKIKSQVDEEQERVEALLNDPEECLRRVFTTFKCSRVFQKDKFLKLLEKNIKNDNLTLSYIKNNLAINGIETKISLKNIENIFYNMIFIFSISKSEKILVKLITKKLNELF
jgi:hypothetical protein